MVVSLRGRDPLRALYLQVQRLVMLRRIRAPE
jgi:hypothetical protein